MKVLFVGLGSIGQRHLRNLRALKGEGVEVLAWRARGLDTIVHDDMQAENADPAAHYDYRAVPTLEAGLAERPQITFVCNPTSMHVPVALAALRAGSHVFLEKPVASSLTGLDELTEEAQRRTELVVYVGYQWLFHPAIQCLEDLLRDETIGRVLSVRAEVGGYLPDFHLYEDYRQGYAARRSLGGGVVLTQSHEINYLCHLFGAPATVFAVGGHLSDLEIDVEDVAVLTMACGTRARPLPVTLSMDFLQRPSVRNCEIIGEHGKIVVDLEAATLVRYGRDGAVSEHRQWPEFRRNDMYVDQLAHFLACCAGEEAPRCDLRSGAQALKVALAALRSIETHAAEQVGV